MNKQLQGKKILCVFPRFYTGGVSKALCFVANTCNEAGMDVHCVSLRNEPETIQLNEGVHRYVYDVIGHSDWRRIVKYAFFFIKFRNFVKKINPNAIVVFRADLVNAVVKITRGLDIPVIGSERGNPLLYGNLLNKYRKAFKMSAAIVYQTPMARDVYNVNVKTAIIPNPGITRHSISQDSVIRKGGNIITVSRLSKEKNIEGLLRAFAKVQEQLSGRKLILYGDGDEQIKLEKLAQELGVSEQVVFAGNVSDFTQKDDDASIFVLNTLSEGMPNALIEAMISGYACICTDCPIGAPRWLSDDGRRVRLVPVRDDDSLSKALLDVASRKEYAESLAKDALEVRDLLSPQRIGKMWLNLIDEVTNEHEKSD